MSGDYKNALPGEVAEDRVTDDDRPREMHSVADKERPLTREEADVAGISTTPEVVYGDNSTEPNEDDQRDAHQG
jgi:hypothetical protein